MKTKSTLIFMLAFLSAGITFGQESGYRKSPVNVSFVYPASIAGIANINSGNQDGLKPPPADLIIKYAAV